MANRSASSTTATLEGRTFQQKLHTWALRAWRRFPWPGGRGRYWCKRRLLEPWRGRGPQPIPTDAGWLLLEWGEDVLQQTLYAGGRHYETEVAQWLTAQQLDGATVLDVGAHAGFYTMMLAKAVGSTGRVVAFEPQPQLANAVTAAIHMNGVSWCQVVRSAVGDREGELSLHRPGDLGRTSAGALPDDEYTTLQVPLLRLESWIEQNLASPPDLIKIDIEGAEGMAVEGLGRWLHSQRRPRLLIEVHPQQLIDLGSHPQEFIDRLGQLGYRVHWLSPRAGRQPVPQPLPSGSAWHMVAEPETSSAPQ